MELFEAILTRRSIRRYEDKKIEKEKTEIILRAAMFAPSAMNYQPWEFIIIDNREKLLGILDIITHAEMLKESMQAVLICGDLNKEKYAEYNVQNCSAATQNLLLAAHDVGLGSVWIAVYPNTEVIAGIRKLFSLPDHILPVSLVALGYPAESKEAEERYFEDKIHYNNW